MKGSFSRIDRRYRRLRQELQVGFAALVGVFLLGTSWYYLVEGWTPIEAAYMTTITLATVGFTEVRPLDQHGRLFTICLIFLGLLTIGYIVNRFTEALIQGYFEEGIRRRQERRLIGTLTNHYILCGFGRTGRQVAIELQAEGVPFVLIDSGAEQVEEGQQLGYIFIQGDATLDESLLHAGIERATCLIAALTSDAENLYTVLSAKALNPKIRAIARASTEEAVTKLQRAGADAVVSPYITGGRRLAAAALRPQVMDFVDGILTGTDRSLYMEEYFIDPNSCCVYLIIFLIPYVLPNYDCQNRRNYEYVRSRGKGQSFIGVNFALSEIAKSSKQLRQLVGQSSVALRRHLVQPQVAPGKLLRR
jgi:voltage-gated potassium channel